MPRYTHDNLGDVLNHAYCNAVVEAVHSSDDTADIQLNGGQWDNIPIFYHCTPDAEKRGNGALLGASSAFHEGDRVIVMVDDGNVPVRVVGFVDGIKQCTTSVDVIFTINGKVPTKIHSIQLVDSTPEEEDGPLVTGGSSTPEEPGAVRDIEITGFVFPIKIYLTDLVEYFRPDPGGMFFFHGGESKPDENGHTTYYIGRAVYNEEFPPDPDDYDYFERATPVGRTLGAVYDEFHPEMSASFTVYTLQSSFTGIAIDLCGCSLSAVGPSLSSSKITNISGGFPGDTRLHHGGYIHCSGDEDKGTGGYYDIGRTHGSANVPAAYISSDEDGLNASFAPATISVDWWRYWYGQQWYNNVDDDPPHGTVVCEGEGSLAEAGVWVWTMIPIQDKYI
ncbi:MAG: hypothetical protein JRI80_04900 [Deltaproteobacteria bacterium]|nr:hypothetical protein [Deltaproteobacteria bacterium]